MDTHAEVDPTPEQAAAALADVKARREQVKAGANAGLAWQLAAASATTLINFAVKDLLASRSARRAVTATCLLINTALSLAAIERTRVQPYNTDDARAAAPAVARLTGASVVVLAAERIMVILLRRSSLARPNLVAGIVLAATRPAAHLAIRRFSLDRLRRDP